MFELQDRKHYFSKLIFKFQKLMFKKLFCYFLGEF